MANRRKLKRNQELSVVVSMVTASYCMGWLPLTVVSIILVFCPSGCGITADIVMVLAILTMASSLANVCIYISRQKEFRRQMKHLCLTPFSSCAKCLGAGTES